MSTVVTCVLCNERIDFETVVDHIRAEHPYEEAGLERWPDGELVVVDQDWEAWLKGGCE